METITLQVDGMSCGHCVGSVRRALEAVDGVQVEQVDIGSASVAYDPTRTDSSRISRAVEEAGYAVRPEAGR
jgi:copper chaperone